MSKRSWFLIGVIIIVATALILVWFANTRNSGNAAYWMEGRVVEIVDNTILISGTARFSENGKERREEKTIDFQLTPKTRFQKTTTIIRRANKGFSSETASGLASDLAKNMRIIRIESNQDLFANKEVTVSYINYETIEIRD